ncbi:ABC_transporter family protein [Hexamita inflata]|uniref:ABC transporter family protein n=1 Tax=Hexamita inflata TaxID=28002 RepID=A0AA86V3B6_9EUKA|nr:ABC transporter family protein [Hexamita inflata]
MYSETYACLIVCSINRSINHHISLLGWLHQFYVSKYNPIDNNSEFIPKPMPVQSYVENINHHILFTLQSNVSAASTAHFGTLPEDEPGSGFIGASNRKWTDNQNKQLRTPFQIPSNISSLMRQSFVPFVTVDDLSCDQPQQRFTYLLNQFIGIILLQ